MPPVKQEDALITPAHVASANGIVVCRPWLKAAAFANGADKLLAIGRVGIGYDKIDLPACTANDVVTFNSPHGRTHSTASAVAFFILALSKRFPLQHRMVREHRWDLQKDAMGDDLSGLTLGIVGLGHSGLELVRLMAPYRMRIVAFSPRADPAKARENNVTLLGSLAEVFKQADYVSLHCRLNEQTRKMIGERELALMKPTAYFVNVARGEIVDEHALIRVLQEHRIAGAGLDVFETEPLPRESPLLNLDNVILTPHWLTSTRQAARLTCVSMMQGMLNVAQGRLPENILNPAVVERAGFQTKLARYKENATGA